MTATDVVVVGAGPNGLAAAVTAARAGLRVELFELDEHIGGGARSAELTLPGFVHDVCSAVHPMAFASPFFRAFELERRVEFVTPEISYAQPLAGGRAALAYHDLERTAEALGPDGAAWTALLGPLSRRMDELMEFTGNALLRLPRHPLVALGFGMRVLDQGSPLWNTRFRGDAAPALLAGTAAHAIGRMPGLATSGAGLLLAAQAHARGWPIPVGGTQRIADALAADLLAHGGRITTGRHIRSLAELPRASAVILDVTPRAFLSIAGDAVPARYAAALRRFRYGNAVAKVDFALSGAVPWANAETARAGTVHLGGSRAQTAAAEAQVAAGRHAEHPFVLVAQPSTVDSSRAPNGQHALWSYAHVPAGSTIDPTEAVTARIEEFAPGFRDVVLASSARSAVELEEHNPNYIGGDIAGGAVTLGQLLRRPVARRDPWRTPVEGVYLCSSSTPPGPGVHGLGGWHAARSALRHEFGIRTAPRLGVDD
ncbi:FAD-dependent oxidoreductase [Galbitalea soli]|uniref:NAD(P)/FAD-dependent oxidoreductase n=1 Tax=Galbitalea soli TaxID=1268042 RepID=A0A7C9PN01_9MICO|nr:NAD(P)/FAD-dependent oxidoreductase [Galbitalea soli]NYJ30024.1 phytoene dehydrogenase-like protein [Galbitalea soli]